MSVNVHELFHYIARSVALRQLYYYKASSDIPAATVHDDPHNISVIVFEPLRANPVLVSRLYYHGPSDGIYVAPPVQIEANPHFIGCFSDYVFNIVMNSAADYSSSSVAPDPVVEANPHFIGRYWLPM